MKSIIVTTSFANNYGALLQNFSLKKYLEDKFGMTVQTLDYWPDNAEAVWKMYYSGRNLRTIVRNVLVFFDYSYRKKMKKRQDMMFSFRKKYLNLTDSCYHSESEILAESNKYQNTLFFCGSDQIWNTTAYWKDPVYFLNFVKQIKSCKSIAYAPSITDKWKSEHKEEIKRYLMQLDCISVRENSDVEQVKSLLPSRDVIQVIDPVFLQTAEEWDAISNKGIKIEGKYILCYFLGTSPSTVRLVKKVKELTGLKVVYLNINYSNPINADIVIREASPIDFVSLIKNAEVVINNSFHCSAFSVIFKRNYLVVPKNHANSRMISLQEMAQISNRLVFDDKIDSLSVNDINVDFSKTDMAISNILSDSVNYLKDAVYGK